MFLEYSSQVAKVTAATTLNDCNHFKLAYSESAKKKRKKTVVLSLKLLLQSY